MSLWGNTDASGTAPKSSPAMGTGVAGAGTSTLYGNTTYGVQATNQVVGVFGVSTPEMANTQGEGKKVQSAGWNLRRAGTGPVTTLTISTAGINYTNGFLTFTATNGGSANASYTCNSATGGINSVTLINGGAGYTIAPTITGTNGTGCSIVATVGGRAGRVHYECLVAQGSQNDGTSDDAILPQ